MLAAISNDKQIKVAIVDDDEGIRSSLAMLIRRAPGLRLAGEREFLDQLAKGYAYREIADRMTISIDTVRSYVRAVYEKLHVHSRTEAAVKCLRG